MPIMLEAVMRVRATRGIRMSSFHGNFFVRSTDLLAMPAVPQDTSYAIELQIEETISSPFVVFQTAILHTTCYGMFIPYNHVWFLTVRQVNVESASSRRRTQRRPICPRSLPRQTRWPLLPYSQTKLWNAQSRISSRTLVKRSKASLLRFFRRIRQV